MTTPAVGPKRRDERPNVLVVRASRMFSTDLSSTPLPARGLFYSLSAHVLLWVVTLYVPWSYWLPPEPHFASKRSIETHEVLLLPDLAPIGSDAQEAQPSSRGRVKQPKEEAPAPASEAKAVQGAVYKGPQLIVSNPSHPDNFIQTIRQPDIAALKLPAPLALPPLVSIAAAARPLLAPPEVVPVSRPVEATAAVPISLPRQQPNVEVPNLPIPAAASADALRTVVNASAPVPIPALAQQAPSAADGNAARNILVVNAVSSPNLRASAVPPGEIYGAFTVSPLGATASAGAPGTDASGSGTGPYAEPGSNLGGGTGTGKIARTDVGPGTGAGNAGAGAEKAPGSASGPAGHGSGSAGESGTARGRNPFPSIRIQGGSGANVRAITQAPGAVMSQSSYGMTIVASGSSGGGFKDYGVFRDETSYTVYLDMSDVGVSGLNWTLQYALDLRPAPNSSAADPRPQGLLVPPYTKLKSLPHFSSEAAMRNRGGTIVVFGVISIEGKFEDMRIIHSPDLGLNQLLLDALGKWTFKPAEIDGRQVPVKVMLGVPVNFAPGS